MSRAAAAAAATKPAQPRSRSREPAPSKSLARSESSSSVGSAGSAGSRRNPPAAAAAAPAASSRPKSANSAKSTTSAGGAASSSPASAAGGARKAAARPANAAKKKSPAAAAAAAAPPPKQPGRAAPPRGAGARAAQMSAPDRAPIVRNKAKSEVQSRRAPAASKEPQELKCAVCGLAFDQGMSYVSALGSDFHHSCFRCTMCDRVLAELETPVYGHEGKPYCQEDYLANFAHVCARCGKEINGKFLQALGHSWHEQCLTCVRCQCSLAGQPIYHRTDPSAANGDADGQDQGAGAVSDIFCERDFKEEFGEVCAACGEVLVGKVVKAMESKFHPDCFKCAECEEPLAGKMFYVENQQVYCKRDFDNLFATKCAACGEPVVGPCLKAVEKTFHNECFACSHCKQQLNTERFFVEGDDFYCQKDYEALFATKCCECGEPIMSAVIHVLGKDWHRECFVCAECKQPLEDYFLKKDGKVYCERDYTKLFELTCAGCDEVLNGEYVEVLGFTWHRECFLCTTCLKPIEADQCYVKDNRVYCSKDFRAVMAATEKEFIEKAMKQRMEASRASDGRKWSVHAPEQVASSSAGEQLEYTKFVRGELQGDEKGAKAAAAAAQASGADSAPGKGPRGRTGAAIPSLSRVPTSENIAIRRGRSNQPLERSASLRSLANDESSALAEKSRSAFIEYSRAQQGFDIATCIAAGVSEAIGWRRRIFRTDFTSEATYSPDVAAGAFEFREFAPCTFQSLRQQYGIDNESFRSSLAKPGAVSRIDEKHFISADKRFTLLAISQREAETLLRILPHYFQHVTRNRHTLLPRFYGLYKLRIPKGETLRIVVTATFADCDGPIDSRFELAPDSKESVFKGKLYVGEQQATAIRQQLSRDCKFLKKASISGHALLVAIQRGKRPAELRYPVDTRMLLRPTVPHPNGGKERGMVSVFEQENGGVRAYEPGNPERSGEIYFFRIDRMLQHAIDIKDGSDRALVQQAASRSQRYNNRFLEIVLNLLV